MKRTITIILILTLALLLIACSGEKCRVCDKKATTQYRYAGVGRGNVPIGDRIHVFYPYGDSDWLCDDCLAIVEATLGKSK
ncbi:MAG TPA: hypothetical protein GX728_00675 [Clostridiaceae bacterium]|nr:hypothetical protein [Clostridiaceae bacterium]